jgi:hypothetical protein
MVSHEHLIQVCTVDAYFTDMAWCAPLARKAAAGANDVCAVACTDGTGTCLPLPHPGCASDVPMH